MSGYSSSSIRDMIGSDVVFSRASCLKRQNCERPVSIRQAAVQFCLVRNARTSTP
jgi:hypothetical protein